MRDRGPERLDQSRIRMHEEPAPAAEQPSRRSSSQQRIRKHTVLGMPSATPPGARPSPASAPLPPPTPLSPARSAGVRTRTPQKTMLGIPRAELPEPASAAAPAEPAGGERIASAAAGSSAPPGVAVQSHRARARVRYDSANEPLPVTRRRQRALRGLAVLVLLAAAWLGYRFLTLHG